ncbi:MAG TPA: methyltransferase domain-containing protein [Candidatus Saccharimonadales bacterium]|nr:methyltransferase domain-containing protein [Candidatus Saccharimonadales bacterium]
MERRIDLSVPAYYKKAWVGGVDLNAFLPFESANFDALDLVEVIEPIENQPQSSREVARVLKPKSI